MAMSDQTPLSELCGICYTDKPKYRCPRCKTQTCSLPCYKRHQQRASCNGKRDPAEYRKKSQLATPAGIDQDYNYLKTVERSIDNASRDASDRGIGTVRSVSKFVYKASLPEGKVQKYLDANRITVNRAPKGMSRQKTNNTRSTKRDNIVWTVEWIDDGGEKDVRDGCSATGTLEDLYKVVQTAKQRLMQPKQAENEEVAQQITRKKRKRNTSSHGAGTKEDSGEDAQKKASTAAAPATTHPDNEDADHPPDDMDTAPVSTETTPPAIDCPHQSATSIVAAPSPSSRDTVDATSLQREEPASEAEPHAHHFYLLRHPTVPSPSKLLLPLSPTQTLTQSLQDQTVLEYPTIYVLSAPPDALPTGFAIAASGEDDDDDDADGGDGEGNSNVGAADSTVAAEDRGGLSRREGPGFQRWQQQQQRQERSRDDDIDEEEAKKAKAPPVVNANKILDMLKRDISRS